MGLDEQQRVIEAMRSSLHPPPGVSAQLVGLPVLAAQADAQVASPWRRLETLLAGLAAVALVLLIAFRGDRRRALVPLAPIVLASGWSALVLFAVRVPLNPMSVTLGALVIAISTEFSVLLSERHRQERQAGHDVGRGAAPHLPPHGRRRRRLGGDGDRRVRRARAVGHRDAARLRPGHADRPERVAAGRAGGAARGAGARSSARAGRAASRRRRAGGSRGAAPARRGRCRAGLTDETDPSTAPVRIGSGAARQARVGSRRLARRPRHPGAGPVSAPTPRYGRYIGLLAVVILVLITINTVADQAERGEGHRSRAARCRRSRCRSRRAA